MWREHPRNLVNVIVRLAVGDRIALQRESGELVVLKFVFYALPSELSFTPWL